MRLECNTAKVTGLAVVDAGCQSKQRGSDVPKSGHHSVRPLPTPGLHGCPCVEEEEAEAPGV